MTLRDTYRSSYTFELGLLNFHRMVADMIVQRGKKRWKVCKAKTVDDALGNFFVFSYKITFRYSNLHHLFKHKKSKTCTYKAGNRHRILFWNFFACNPRNLLANAEVLSALKFSKKLSKTFSFHFSGRTKVFSKILLVVEYVKTIKIMRLVPSIILSSPKTKYEKSVNTPVKYYTLF